MPYKLRKTTAAVGLFLILSFMIVIVPEVKVVKAEPNTIVVPDDYISIQEAIDGAAEGDTVYVDGGIYFENLVINKTISLIGKNKETTTVYCRDNTHPTVLVREDGVNITGFTIRNNVVSPSQTHGRLAAVHLLHVSHCNIYGNIMVDSGYGVWLYGSQNNNISDNIITNTNHGILIESSWDNTIIRNTASNSWTGIWILSASGNMLRNNSMLDNSRNFGVSGTTLAHYSNDIDTSNLVNDKKVHYLVNEKNLEISPSFFPDLGFLALINCTNITVKNLNIANNHYGLLLVNTSNSTVTNNKIAETTMGIWLQFSFGIIISENSLDSNSDDGIRLENSERTLIDRNSVEHTGLNGIYLGASNNNYIIENTMTENINYGIHLEVSSNNALIGNELTNSIWGITLRHSPENKIESNRISSHKFESAKLTQGLQGIIIVHDSDNCSIVGNTVINNSEYGINIQSSSHISVCGNNITNNKSGLKISYSSNNTVTANNISDSSEFAIYFSNSNNTAFYSNNFINNAKQIDDHYWHVTRWHSPSVNIWDNGIEGNYWSNYNGTDNDGDGIGDTPYIIDEKNQDNYPLIEPFIIPEFPSWIILPVFSTITLLVIVYRKKLSKTGNPAIILGD